ncbi:reverse transcriptase/maturase family protein [Enterococcus raffinosus]|uniref:reverse transcriptase/maturase family protein n=1 Tax=Enterococcus raffinosus TaxID=71452 RepID=UPI00288E4071|nr:reverse transcriptase/maturase family protein [Enterococcus raffinosus]MDT2529525.1 reverse transcriptase/maturase family protein [Enterococcus raffinosus]MDT2578008.1 reverse transcriptase/maturase family protein [Enterococcus raffinosus]
MNKDVYKYSTKKYLHFDKITSFNSKVEKYVYEFEKNPIHSFLPLIFNEINIEKFRDLKDDPENENKSRNGRKVPVKEKNRPIMYASHIDNYIYKHYGLQLNELYNIYVSEKNFDSSVLAYRTNKHGKNNIHFAAEVINFIAEHPNSFVYVGDYTGFFDNLDHEYLKRMINRLYCDNRMPDHQFKIYKSMTKYSYIHKEDINYFVAPDKEIYASRKNSYFTSFADFRRFKKMKSHYFSDGKIVVRTNNDEKGIPQGTAISAIYSNIYMLEIDESISSLVNNYGGIYRRYSDDFIIILPDISEELFDNLRQEIENNIFDKTKMSIQKEKTNIMYFDGKVLRRVNAHTMTKLDYLGFVFDGTNAKMREKSITKFYRTAYKLIKKGEIVSKQKRHIGDKMRLTYKRKLYQNYHQLGERTDIKYHYKQREFGTFITYARKSQKIFDILSPMTCNLMSFQIRNHQKNIQRKIRDAEKNL